MCRTHAVGLTQLEFAAVLALVLLVCSWASVGHLDSSSWRCHPSSGLCVPLAIVVRVVPLHSVLPATVLGQYQLHTMSARRMSGNRLVGCYPFSGVAITTAGQSLAVVAGQSLARVCKALLLLPVKSWAKRLRSIEWRYQLRHDNETNDATK